MLRIPNPGRSIIKMAPNANIPIIDVSKAVDEADVARRVVDAAAEHGFIYIKNTGDFIGLSDIDGAFDLVGAVALDDETLTDGQKSSLASFSRLLSKKRPPALSRPTTVAGQVCIRRLWTPRRKR